MSKVLFLDIDGVLLPFGSYNWDLEKVFARPYNYLKRMVNRSKTNALEVQKLVAENDYQVVLISTWRYLFPEQFLKDYLDGIGFGPYLHDDWIAVNGVKNYAEKGVDIQLWLNKHPEVQEFKIVDDHDVGVPVEDWIKTDADKGYFHGPARA